MRKYGISFKNTDEIRAFVRQMNRVECEVDLISGRNIVDAKSLVGVMAMSESRNLEVVIHMNEEPEWINEVAGIVA